MLWGKALISTMRSIWVQLIYWVKLEISSAIGISITFDKWSATLRGALIYEIDHHKVRESGKEYT